MARIKRTIFWNGEFIQKPDAFIQSYAPGAFNARGAFETMLTYRGNIIDLDEHLARLRAGLKTLKISFPAKLKTIAKEVVKRNPLTQGRLRISVWKKGGKVQVMVVCVPYTRPSSAKYRKGFRVGIYPQRIQRKNQPHLKSLEYAPFYKAFLWAQKNGLDEALIANQRGEIFEGSRSNFFCIEDGVWYTPRLKSGCLNGITRQKVLAWARREKISIREAVIRKDLLLGAQEIFLTNSLFGVVRAKLSRT